MNIHYTHKFVDPIAKQEAVRQNLKHMMVLFWWDNIPQEVRAMRQPWLDDAEEAIEDFIDDLPGARLEPIDAPLAKISDFLSMLVTHTVAMYKDNTHAV